MYGEKKRETEERVVDVCVFAVGQISAAQPLQCRGGDLISGRHNEHGE